MSFKNLDLRFKNHIQGLRAISVILVFLYHLNFDFFSKGYLGVDIFFVISGFVITQSIYKDYLIKKKIDIKYFYVKRFKRIIPNLLFILSFIFILFLFIGPPQITLWNDFLTSLLGISNLYFLFSDKGYFYNIFDNPFAHTWSLGVEEQFYLIYPFLLLIIFKFFKNKNIYLINIISVLIIISLSFSVYSSFINPDFSFYFSPLRFWELGFGCLCFFISSLVKKNNILSVFSILVVLSTVLFEFNIKYILNNIIVVFFSGIFIIFCEKFILVNNKFCIWLGKVSYSFYLWHLPIIYFINIYFSNIVFIFFSSFILSIILSSLSYNLIEKKFIQIKVLENKNNFAIISIILFSLVSLISIKYLMPNIKQDIRVFIYKSNYLEKNYNWIERVTFQNIFINNKEIHKYCGANVIKPIINVDGLRSNCLKQDNYSYLFFVEGNSHTAQFITPLNNINNIKNLYYSSTNQNFISEKKILNLTNKFDRIIYVTDVNNQKKLDKLRSSEIIKIKNIELLLFNSTPFLNTIPNPTYCLSRQINCEIIKKKDIQIRNLKTLNNQITDLKTSYPNVYLFDSYNLLCPIEKCKIYDKSNDILYYMDKTHLSIEGAMTLTEKLSLFVDNNLNLEANN